MIKTMEDGNLKVFKNFASPRALKEIGPVCNKLVSAGNMVDGKGLVASSELQGVLRRYSCWPETALPRVAIVSYPDRHAGMALHRDHPLQGGSHTLLIFVRSSSGGDVRFPECDTTVDCRAGNAVMFAVDELHSVDPGGPKLAIALELAHATRTVELPEPESDANIMATIVNAYTSKDVADACDHAGQYCDLARLKSPGWLRTSLSSSDGNSHFYFLERHLHDFDKIKLESGVILGVRNPTDANIRFQVRVGTYTFDPVMVAPGKTVGLIEGRFPLVTMNLRFMVFEVLMSSPGLRVIAAEMCCDWNKLSTETCWLIRSKKFGIMGMHLGAMAAVHRSVDGHDTGMNKWLVPFGADADFQE